MTALLLAVLGGAIAYYLYSRPQRDVVATDADATLSAETLVNEFLTDEAAANARYLDAEGESQVLALSGTVAQVQTNLNGLPVVLLQHVGSLAGVRCTFDSSTATDATQLQVGQAVTLKGVIRAGAAYDADLDLYEHAILEKCTILRP